MADVLTPAQRRLNMSRIRSTNSVPEMRVRRLTHGMGYRYTVHDEGLPGTPDLVFASRRKVIFVHGCYWHRHSCPLGRPVSKTNTAFWSRKLAGNVARDARQQQELRDLGWDVLVLWECETQLLPILKERIQSFLGPSRRQSRNCVTERV
jgi:DNA mismatch endonuclease, patch repair protein